MGAWRAAAFLWGLAEASFFFLVPDILLGFLVQKRGMRPAMDAACFAVAGACLGGLLMWHVGRGHPEGMRAFLDGIPAISSAMITQAGVSLRDNSRLHSLPARSLACPTRCSPELPLKPGSAGRNS